MHTAEARATALNQAGLLSPSRSDAKKGTRFSGGTSAWGLSSLPSIEAFVPVILQIPSRLGVDLPQVRIARDVHAALVVRAPMAGDHHRAIVPERNQALVEESIDVGYEEKPVVVVHLLLRRCLCPRLDVGCHENARLPDSCHGAGTIPEPKHVATEHALGDSATASDDATVHGVERMRADDLVVDAGFRRHRGG